MSLALTTIDEPAVRRGKVLVHVVIAWLILQALFVVGWRFWVGDRNGLIFAMVDLMVSMAFSYALHLGHTWARYLTVVANGLGIVILATLVALLYPQFGRREWGIVLLLLLPTLGVIFLMLMSYNVGQFFTYMKMRRGARRYELLAAMSEERRRQVTTGGALVFLSILFFMLLNSAGSIGFLGAILSEIPIYGSFVVLLAWAFALAMWNGSSVARWVIVLHSLILLGLVIYGSYWRWARLMGNPMLMAPSVVFLFGTVAIVLMLTAFRSVGVFLQFQWDLPAPPTAVPGEEEVTVSRQDAIEEPRVIDYVAEERDGTKEPTDGSPWA
jgi:hypothetical protein